MSKSKKAAKAKAMAEKAKWKSKKGLGKLPGLIAEAWAARRDVRLFSKN